MRVFAGFLLLFPLSLFATNVTVDCSGATPGAFTSINAALATLDSVGPHLVSVSGTCLENALISSHDRVTLQGSPAATIHPLGGIALRVDHSRGVALRNLTLTGGVRALWIQRHSDATVEGTTIENTPNGLVVDDGGMATLGGPSPSQAVTIRNNNFAAVYDGATVYANGNVTFENNGSGIDAEHSRLAFLGTPAAPNAIRNNGNNGLFAHGGSDVDFRGVNQVTGNGLNGILGFQNTSIDVIGTATQMTTIDGNGRGGVAYIFNSSGRVQNAIVTNNGSATQPLSSGVTSGQNSSVIISGTTISGIVGPAVIVDSGGMARIATTTISGNTAEPVHLATGGVLELQTGNTISASGDIVSCDDSAVLFGDGADVKTSCKKTK